MSETPNPDAVETDHLVGMVRRVASRWVESNVHDEYRLTVYQSVSFVRNLPMMLKSFRDGRIRVGSIEPIRDLGIRVGFDQLELWSADREGLVALDGWLRKAGCETTGIW